MGYEINVKIKELFKKLQNKTKRKNLEFTLLESDEDGNINHSSVTIINNMNEVEK